MRTVEETEEGMCGPTQDVISCPYCTSDLGSVISNPMNCPECCKCVLWSVVNGSLVPVTLEALYAANTLATEPMLHTAEPTGTTTEDSGDWATKICRTCKHFQGTDDGFAACTNLREGLLLYSMQVVVPVRDPDTFGCALHVALEADETDSTK